MEVFENEIKPRAKKWFWPIIYPPSFAPYKKIVLHQVFPEHSPTVYTHFNHVFFILFVISKLNVESIEIVPVKIVVSPFQSQ